MSEKANEIEIIHINSKEFEREMTLVYLLFKKDVLENQLKSSYSQYQSIPVKENYTHLDNIHLQKYQIDTSVNYIKSIVPIWSSIEEINKELLNYQLNINDTKQIQLKIKNIASSIIMPSPLENIIQTSYHCNLKSNEININDMVVLDNKGKSLIIGKVIYNDKINFKTEIHIENNNHIVKNHGLDFSSIQIPYVVMEQKKAFSTQYEWIEHHVNINPLEAKPYTFHIRKLNENNMNIDRDKKFIKYSSHLYNVNKLKDISYNKSDIDKVDLKYQSLEIQRKYFHIQKLNENNIKIDRDKRFIEYSFQLYNVEKLKYVLYSLPNIDKVDELKVNYINNHINIKLNNDFHMTIGNHFKNVPHIESIEPQQQDMEKLELIDFNEIQTIWNEFLMSL